LIAILFSKSKNFYRFSIKDSPKEGTVSLSAASATTRAVHPLLVIPLFRYKNFETKNRFILRLQ
jgi:hypothetical protein